MPNPLPLTVAALRNLELIDIPGRPAGMPTMYLYTGASHPHRPRFRAGQRTYVYLFNPSQAGKTRVLSETADYDPPGGVSDPVRNPHLLGWLPLTPGDWVMARDIASDGDPVNDVPKVIVAESGAHLDSKKATVIRARDVVLGPRESRTSGQTWFEESRCTNKINGTRCYTMGPSLQHAAKTLGPAAAFKFNGDTEEMDEPLEAAHEFIQATSDYACTAWEHEIPDFIKTPLKERHERICAPTTGVPDNYVWSTFQMNTAPAQAVDTQRSLSDYMGIFGRKHIDSGDSESTFSSMTVLSDLPTSAGWDPGRFHIADLGVYVVLNPFVVIFFSGLHPHGGSPPLAPPGIPVPPWAFRLVVIGYPPRLSTMGDVKYPLARLPSGDTLFITQEMTGVESPTKQKPRRSVTSTMAKEGAIIMSPQSHFRFFVRSLLVLVVYLIGQLPERYNVRVDSQQFLSAFTMTDGDDDITPGEWDLAPAADVRHPFSSPDHRQAVSNVATVLHDRIVPTIPYKGGRRPNKARGPAIITTEDRVEVEVEEIIDQPVEPVASVNPSTPIAGTSDPTRVSKRLRTTAGYIGVPPHSLMKGKFVQRENMGNDNDDIEMSDEDLSTEAVPIDTRGARMYVGVPPSLQNAGDEITDNTQHPALDKPHPGELPEETHEHVVSSGGISRTASFDDALSASVSVSSSKINAMRIQQRNFFFDSLTVPVLVTAIDTLSRTRLSASPSNLDSLFAMLSTMTTDLDMSTVGPRVLGDYLANFGRVRLYTNSAERVISVCRQQVMLLETSACIRMFDLCDTYLGDMSTTILNSSDVNNPDWLVRLLARISVLVRSVLPVNISSSTFVPAIQPPVSYTDYRGRVIRNRNFGPTEQVTEIKKHLFGVIQQWFTIPDLFKLHARSRFVTIMVQHLGEGVLLLPSVWTAYNQTPLWMFSHDTPSRRVKTIFESRFLDDFEQQLGQSSMADLHSHERALFAHLHSLHHDTVPVTSSMSTSPSYEISTTVKSVILFLSDAWTVSTNGLPGGASNALQLMNTNDDYYMPLREMTLARRCVHSSFTPNFIVTRAGLFSLLVFRNILFNTDALRQSPSDARRVCFASVEDFDQYIESLKAYFTNQNIAQHPDFYCNRKAYGHTLARRLVSTASNLWQASQGCIWPPTSMPMAFVDALDWVSRLKHDFNIVEFGSLGQYSLVADMCAMSIVQMPTMDEMSKVIKTLGLGSLKGLRALGYLEEGAATTVASVTDAFSLFYSHVEVGLHDHPYLQPSWSPIVAEHTLCKVTRMIRKHCYNHFK